MSYSQSTNQLFVRKDSAWVEVLAQDDADTRYVNVGGDTMTGQLVANAGWKISNPPDAGHGTNMRTDGVLETSVTGVPGSTTLTPNLVLGRGGAPAATGGQFITFRGNSSSSSTPQANLMGSVAVNAVNTSVVYNTTSDARLKDVVRPVEPGEALDRVLAVEPVIYLWKTAPEAGEQIGFLAQDLATVAPEAVTEGHGEPDDDDFVPWAVDLSTLVPTLCAAIAALTARIAQLEGGAA
jgi:hypothetical protein